MNIKKDYPNIVRCMSGKWISRFNKSANQKVVEKLFDYLEDAFINLSKEVNPLTEDLVFNVNVVSRNWKNFFRIEIEKLVYHEEYEGWRESGECPLSVEIRIQDWYRNYNEEYIQEMVEDFLNALPEKLGN